MKSEVYDFIEDALFNGLNDFKRGFFYGELLFGRGYTFFLLIGDNGKCDVGMAGILRDLDKTIAVDIPKIADLLRACYSYKSARVVLVSGGDTLRGCKILHDEIYREKGKPENDGDTITSSDEQGVEHLGNADRTESICDKQGGNVGAPGEND